jgi:glutamate/aspartate transport system substrate-binding protein
MKKHHLLLALVAGLVVQTANAQALDGTLKKIKDSNSITLGIRESSFPLSYLDASQKPIGYHIDICNAIVDAVKAKLALPKLEVKTQAVTSQNRIPLVVNGTVDLECGSTTNNLDRQKQVAFAPTTYVTQVRIAVKKASGIKTLEQLHGKPIVTSTGTTSVQLIRANEKGKNLDFKEVYGKDHADSFLMLEQDRAAAFVLDDNLLMGEIANSKAPQDYELVGEPLSTEPIAIMLRKDDPQFKGLVTATIAGLAKSGELAKLYVKWFESPIPPKNLKLNLPLSAALKDAFANPNDKPAESYKK